MSTLLDIELEGLPPTVNRMYGRQTTHIYKRSEVQDWQDGAVREIRQEWGDKPAMNGAVELSIEYTTKDRRRWDIDNRVKAVQDTLQQAEVISDDRIIERLHVSRKYGTRNKTRLILRQLDDETE